MKKIFILLLSFSFFCLQGFSQIVEQPPENEASFSQDTALINRYVKKVNGISSIANKIMLDTAYFYLKKIYSLSQYHHYKRGLAEYYRLSSTVYNSRYLYDSSALAIQKEFYWARHSNDPMEIAEAFAATAIRYQHLDELDSSVKYYIKAVHISDSVGNLHFSGKAYNNLSILFYNIGDHKNAIKYATAGYHTGKTLNDSTIFLSCLINLAGIKKDLLHQYDPAIVLYEQVKESVKHSAKYKTLCFNATINEGDILSEQKQYKEALKKYLDVLDHKDKIGAYMLRYVYSGMGNTFFDMKEYVKAGNNISKAIGIDKQINAKQELSKDYESLSKIKEAERQFEAALFYHEKYDSLKDALLNESTQKNMHLLEVKYQTAQKNKQIAQQKLTLSQRQQSIERKTTWMLIFLGGLIALVAILILSIRNYRHKRSLHQQNLQTLQKQHEVNTLKTKMEAREEERNRIGKEMHDDIGSALTTILYLSNDLKTQSNGNNKHTSVRIAETAGNVVDKMNEIIWSMNQEYDTLDDLIAYTRQHAANFLKNYNLDYHFETPDPVPEIHLQGEQRRNIYLVIKESLHNIVKHACATKVEITFLLNKKLTVTIHDNGKGVDKEKLRRFGNGLRNMNQRMKAVGGSFEIIANNGTYIKLECPVAVNS